MFAGKEEFRGLEERIEQLERDNEKNKKYTIFFLIKKGLGKNAFNDSLYWKEPSLRKALLLWPLIKEFSFELSITGY